MLTLCKLLIFRQSQCVTALLCWSFGFALHHLTAENRLSCLGSSERQVKIRQQELHITQLNSTVYAAN